MRRETPAGRPVTPEGRPDPGHQRGYVPTSFGGRLGHLEADKISETGGYAHLITAGAQYLFCLEGKSDWQEERIPSVE